MAHENVQNMISFADTKANMTLSIQGLLVGIALGTSVLAKAFEKVQSHYNSNVATVFYLLVVGFAVSSICGIILSILVYRARLTPGHSGQQETGLLFFGHVVQFPTFDEYLSEIGNIDENRTLKEITEQVYELSHIAEKKMVYVNTSICFLVFNICLAAALMIWSGHMASL